MISRNHVFTQGDIMKRSRRVILTMMGGGTIGAISMGFTGPQDCGPGSSAEVTKGPNGRPIVTCKPVVYRGFGRFPHHLHGHGHGHGRGHGGG
jgi:hypothetical protein